MGNELSHEIEVLWGDLDALGHVNNTVFLRYLEEARIRLFHQLGSDWMQTGSGPVVVNINCNFRREIRYPATVRVTIKATRESEKRILMRHTITDASDPAVLYADAEITAVWVDSGTGRSVPLPQPVRDIITG